MKPPIFFLPLFVAVGGLSFSLLATLVTPFSGLWLVPFISICYLAAKVSAPPTARISSTNIAQFTSLGVAVTVFCFGSLSDAFVQLESDPYLYDAIARDIASSIPLLQQLNPFSLTYIQEIGWTYGSLANLGFYKLLGIIYTVSQLAGHSDPHVIAAALINIPSFVIIGSISYQLLSGLSKDARVRWLLWGSLLVNPWMTELIVNLRKDLLVLALSCIVLLAIRRGRLTMLVFSLFGLALTRLPQAALLGAMWIGSTKVMVRPKIQKWLPVVALVCGVGIVAVVVSQSWFLELAPESVGAYEEHRASLGSVGFSRYLEGNIWGAALWGVLYPFPRLGLPEGIWDAWTTAYAWLSYGLWAIALGWFRRYWDDPFLRLCLLALAGLMLGFSVMTILSWNTLGYVIFEARYKLLGQLLVVLMCAGVLERRKHKGVGEALH